MRRVCIALVSVAFACGAFGTTEATDEGAGGADSGAPDAPSTSDGVAPSDAASTDEATPSPDAASGAPDRCGDVFVQDFEHVDASSFDGADVNGLGLSTSASGTFAIVPDPTRAGSRVALFEALRPDTESPSLSLDVDRPCQTTVRFKMRVAHGALADMEYVTVLDASIRRPSGPTNGLSLQIVPDGIRLVGAGAYHVIHRQDTDWQEVAITLGTNAQFRLSYGGETVVEDVASGSVASPLVSFSIGVVATKTSADVTVAIDDLRIE